MKSNEFTNIRILWPAKTVKLNLTWYKLIYLVRCLRMTRKSWHIKKNCGGPQFTMLNTSPLWLRNIQRLPINSTIKLIFLAVASKAFLSTAFFSSSQHSPPYSLDYSKPFSPSTPWSSREVIGVCKKFPTSLQFISTFFLTHPKSKG